MSLSHWLHVSPLFRTGSPRGCLSALLADRGACVLASVLPASVLVNEQGPGGEGRGIGGEDTIFRAQSSGLRQRRWWADTRVPADAHSSLGIDPKPIKLPSKAVRRGDDCIKRNCKD